MNQCVVRVKMKRVKMKQKLCMRKRDQTSDWQSKYKYIMQEWGGDMNEEPSDDYWPAEEQWQLPTSRGK